MASKKKKEEKKVFQRLKEYKDIEVPYHVWTCFSESAKRIYLYGDQASFGEDSKSLPELRKAVEWYADQLGGKVKWEE